MVLFKKPAPVFRNDHAHLPLYRFLRFINNSGVDLVSAWDEFKETRKWVTKNKYRWKCDARSVTKRWDTSSLCESDGHKINFTDRNPEKAGSN